MKTKGPALLLALSLLFTVGGVCADNVSELPGAWKEQLLDIPRPDLSRLTAQDRERAKDLRARLSTELERQATAEIGEELASLYGELGKVYQIMNLQTQAERCYRNANSLLPDSFRWAYYLAYLSHKNGDLKTALERYRKADRIKPGYTPLTYRVADICLDLDQIDEAEPLFQEILQHEEFAAAGHYGLGQIELFRRNYENAIPHLQQALQQQPEAKQLHYLLGQAYRASGRLEEAREHFDLYEEVELAVYDPLVHELDALRSPSRLLFVDAMDAVHRQDYDAAAELFRKGLEHNPDNASARTSYARALYLSGNTAESRRQLELSNEQKPDRPITLFLLAQLDEASGNTGLAAERYQKIIELKPNHEGAHFYLGNYHLRNHRYRQAIKHYDASLESGNKGSVTRVFRLVARLLQGFPEMQAYDLVAGSNRTLPGIYPLIRLQVLMLALSPDDQVRDADAARKIAADYVEKSPTPAALELLAIANAAQGDFDRANELIYQVNASLSGSENRNRRSRYTLALRNRELPALDLEQELMRIMPPAANPVIAFRDYPDPRPVM